MVRRSLADRDPPKGKRGVGKARFLAHKDEIALALDKGWNQRDVWQDLKDRGVFEFSYVQFTKYVARYIDGRVVDPGNSVTPKKNKGSKTKLVDENPRADKPEETTASEDLQQGPLRVQGVKIKEGVKHQPQAGSVKDSDLF